MENIEQILQKLVAVNLPPLESDKVQHLIQHAFEAGKAERPDPLEGYSNLTAALEAGEPIDWEKLDGKKVQCDNPDVGTNRGELERRERVASDSPDGWWKGGMGYIWANALTIAWNGEDGWTLWIEGDIPLVRKTADQLEVGTYFITSIESRKYLMYVGGWDSEVHKTIHFAPAMGVSNTPASEWVVLEELGPCGFVEPEGK